MLNIDHLKILHFAVIQLYINYGVLAWGNAAKSIAKHVYIM